MIRSFASKRLRRLFEYGDGRGLPPEQLPKIENRLAVIDAANTIDDCNVAGFKLHALSGDYKGYHSVSITGNWRIVFRLVGGDAFDLDHLDYH